MHQLHPGFSFPGVPASANRNRNLAHPTIPNTMIQNKAILVKFSGQKFSPTVKNKHAVAQYCATEGINPDDHEALDKLVPKAWREPIGALYSKIGRFVRDNTLPWDDRGYRLLSAVKSTKFMDDLAKLRAEWDEAVRHFVDNYHQVLADAQAHLNGRFDRSKYPAPDRIADAFLFRVDYAPVPERGHFVSDTIQEIVAEDSARKLEESAYDLRHRFTERVRYLISRCKAYEPGEGRMKSAVLQNVLDIIDEVPQLMVKDDPELLAAVDEAKKILVGIDIDAIKASDSTRSDIADRAQRMLDAFKF